MPLSLLPMTDIEDEIVNLFRCSVHNLIFSNLIEVFVHVSSVLVENQNYTDQYFYYKD